jgi:hypothetical protein
LDGGVLSVQGYLNKKRNPEFSQQEFPAKSQYTVGFAEASWL